MNGENGRFIRRKTSFSMVSNEILRDNTISLRAKGLYSIIQSYITMENFTLYKSFLERNCVEGERAFDKAWKELKDNGYLKQYKKRDGSKGFYYEYELLDIPDTEEKVIEIKKVNKEKDIVEKIKEQIGYHAFEDYKLHIVDEIILIMSEIYMMKVGTLRINRNEIGIENVKNRFLKLNHSHIDYAIETINTYSGSIKNTKNFMITTLYNAPSTMSIYYRNLLNNDMFGT